jgi:hypothetical protein
MKTPQAATDYNARIDAMDDAALLKESEHKIWLSAYAANNPKSDYHWHADACLDAWRRRGKPEQYQVALDNAKASCG